MNKQVKIISFIVIVYFESNIDFVVDPLSALSFGFHISLIPIVHIFIRLSTQWVDNDHGLPAPQVLFVD